MDLKMVRSGSIIQECPVCGRPLSILSMYLGSRVTCQHCGGRFLASKPTVRNGSSTGEANSLLQRAEELIERAARRLEAAARTVAVAGS
jgi:DNA-directed RNA polymerase subunit RPC12/RpoP